MSAAVAGGSPRRRGRDRSGTSPSDEAARVKVEADVDIKDYAETTMNELLGWYGYDKLDTRGLNLRSLPPPLHTSSSSSSPLRNDEDFSEDDTGRSRSPPMGDAESVAPNAVGGAITCAWCLKTGLKLFTLKTSSGKTKVFCSEPCFNQCRRAAFKKNRVCNWCRHVRHTVNYVDFKDGDEQLQFCSDKCLNQYKMQIFCKETQAYLQMNPHLQEESGKHSGTPDSKLITPDLWLRDCQETANGEGMSTRSPSDEDAGALSSGSVSLKHSNGLEVEDLTLTSKSERSNSSGGQKERRTPSDLREKLDDSPESCLEKRSFNVCNASPYLREDGDKIITSERKHKRHYESEKEYYRKRQKMSLRHKPNQQKEAPPAHLSSTALSPLSLQSHNSRLFHQSPLPYLPSMTSNSQTSLNPPAAHTKTLPPHPSITNPLLPPGLPPPPPLLNSDFMHSPFNPSVFPTSQQHLDAVLRMQSMLRSGEHIHPHFQQEPPFSMLSKPPSQPHSTSLLQPNTVMLPYPIFVPLPVPIPIPIPLANFLLKDKKQTRAQKNQTQPPEASVTNSKIDAESSVSDKNISANRNSKHESNGLHFDNTKREKTSCDISYAISNNDTHSNRLILTRNKTR